MSLSLPFVAGYRKQLRIALLLLMLGAFGVQQWAMQSHWHASVAAQAGDEVSSEASSPGSGGDQDRRGGGLPLDKDCLWCHAASHGSTAAAPPALMQLAVTAAHSFVRLPAGIALEFPAAPAHAWHSRGPPQA
jgi:hypothetical protein